MRFAKPTLLFALIVGLVIGTPADARRVQTGRLYEIVTPTGNIDCLAYIDWEKTGGNRNIEMRCSLTHIARPLPRPETDGCDWFGGRELRLGARGAGERFAPCDSIASFQPEKVRLAYGRVWQRAPYTCLSSRLALVCTNADGHGLLLSYEQQVPF
jgi:hypothetical protein